MITISYLFTSEFKRVFVRSWPHNRIFSLVILLQIKLPKDERSPPWAGGDPVAGKRSLLNNRGCNRFRKSLSTAVIISTRGLRSVDHLGLPDESLPSNISVPIHSERRVEDRGLQVDRRVSTKWTLTLFGPGGSPIGQLWKKLLHG